MQVRQAELADVPAMARVFVDTFRAAHRGQVPDSQLLERTYETSAAGWARTIAAIEAGDAPGDHVLVAQGEDGEVVGLVMGDSTTGECLALYVDVAAQGSGAGRALLVALGERVHADGAERLLVGVLAANHPARAFYERMGGVQVETRPYDDGDGVLLDEVVYAYDLPLGR